MCERLEHLERLRNDSAFLDALGADSIPDPKTGEKVRLDP